MERRDFIFMPEVSKRWGIEGLKSALVFPATLLAEIMATAPLPHIGGYGLYGDYGAGKTTFMAQVVVEEGIRRALMDKPMPSVLYLPTETGAANWYRLLKVLAKKYSWWFSELADRKILTQEELDKLFDASQQVGKKIDKASLVRPVVSLDDLFNCIGVTYEKKESKKDDTGSVTVEYVVLGIDDSKLKDYEFLIIDSITTLLRSTMSAFHMISRRPVVVSAMNELGARFVERGSLIFVTGHAKPAWSLGGGKRKTGGYDYRNYSLTADSTVGFMTKVIALLKRFDADGKELQNSRIFEVRRALFAGRDTIHGYFAILETLFVPREVEFLSEVTSVSVPDMVSGLQDLIKYGFTAEDIVSGDYREKIEKLESGKSRVSEAKLKNMKAVASLLEYYGAVLSERI